MEERPNLVLIYAQSRINKLIESVQQYGLELKGARFLASLLERLQAVHYGTSKCPGR